MIYNIDSITHETTLNTKSPVTTLMCYWINTVLGPNLDCLYRICKVLHIDRVVDVLHMI